MLPREDRGVNALTTEETAVSGAHWRSNLVDDDAGIAAVLARTSRIAVLGIKPESRAFKPAHYVPRYLQSVGFDVVPVPVYYPDVESILGEPVHRRVAAIRPPVDLVNVFRRPRDIPPHVDDLIRSAPDSVWFQAGIRNEAAAERLARAGIRVVQDRCLMVEHRRHGVGPADHGPGGSSDRT